MVELTDSKCLYWRALRKTAVQAKPTEKEATIVRLSQPLVDYKPIRTVSMEARNPVVFAYEARRAKQWELLPALATEAQQDHELGAYPMYWYLRYQLSQKTIPTAALQKFIMQYPRTYVAERLKAEWAVAAARVGDMQTILLLGEPKVKHSAAQCAFYQAQATARTKLDVKTVLQSIKDNETCWSMLASLKSLGVLSAHDLRDNFRAAVEYDNKSVAYAYAQLFLPRMILLNFVPLCKILPNGSRHSQVVRNQMLKRNCGLWHLVGWLDKIETVV